MEIIVKIKDKVQYSLDYKYNFIGVRLYTEKNSGSNKIFSPIVSNKFLINR